MCLAGDEDDALYSELEAEGDGSLAGHLRHRSRSVTLRIVELRMLATHLPLCNIDEDHSAATLKDPLFLSIFPMM